MWYRYWFLNFDGTKHGKAPKVNYTLILKLCNRSHLGPKNDAQTKSPIWKNDLPIMKNSVLS